MDPRLYQELLRKKNAEMDLGEDEYSQGLKRAEMVDNRDSVLASPMIEGPSPDETGMDLSLTAAQRSGNLEIPSAASLPQHPPAGQPMVPPSMPAPSPEVTALPEKVASYGSSPDAQLLSTPTTIKPQTSQAPGDLGTILGDLQQQSLEKDTNFFDNDLVNYMRRNQEESEGESALKDAPTKPEDGGVFGDPREQASVAQQPNALGLDPAIMTHLNQRDQELREAQAQASRKRRLAGVMEGISEMAHGIGGASGKPISYANMRADANQPVKDLLERRKQKMGQAELQLKKDKLAKDLKDKDKKASPAMLAMAKRAGLKIKDGATEQDIKNILPLLSAAHRGEGLKQNQKKIDEYFSVKGKVMEKEHERQMEKDKWRMSEKQEISDKQTQTMNDYDDVIREIEAIKKMKKGLDTGPIAGRVGSMRTKIGIPESKMAVLQTKVGRNLFDYIKSKSGVQFSDKERAAQMANYLNTNLDDEQFIAIADSLIEEMKRKRSTQMESLRRQGKDPRSFEEKNRGYGGSGTREPFDAPLPNKEFQEQKTLVSPNEDSEAVKWAKENPSDPRAQKILKLNGVK